MLLRRSCLRLNAKFAVRRTHIIEELGGLEVDTRGYKKYNTLVNILRERLNGADIAKYLMEVDDIIGGEEK